MQQKQVSGLLHRLALRQCFKFPFSNSVSCVITMTTIMMMVSVMPLLSLYRGAVQLQRTSALRVHSTRKNTGLQACVTEGTFHSVRHGVEQISVTPDVSHMSG